MTTADIKQAINDADQALAVAAYAIRKAKSNPQRRDEHVKTAAAGIAEAAKALKAAQAPAKKAPAKKAPAKKAKK